MDGLLALEYARLLPKRGVELNFQKGFPPRRVDEFNFRNVSRQDEGSNCTFEKFPAKTRVRIGFEKGFPLNYSRDGTSNLMTS